MSELQNLVTKSARYVFFVTLAIAVPLIVWGGFIMRIFGDEFIVAYVPLLILLAGQLLSAYFGFATVIIYLTGNERVAGSFMAVNVGSNIVLNYLFITNFGVNGAAIATAITTIIWNLFLTIYLKQKININSAIL
jgi:O-antigen/teichoic acid export membrane protein